MEKSNHLKIPRPTSESECFNIARYNYVDHNIIPDDLRREQEVQIKKLEETTGPVRRCDGSNQKLCSHDDKSCINRNFDRACPDDCQEGCKNNPWRKGDFCINQGKTYLNWEPGKNYGLFAHQDIRKGEFIGQYTGKVTRSCLNMTKEQKMYAMKLEGCNQIIDASEIGSACRLINHSCNPNCDAVEITHNRQFKIVVVATRNIKAGSELTLHYGWEFKRDEENVKCLCGSMECSGWIGSVMEEYYQDLGIPMPKTFKVDASIKDNEDFLSPPTAHEEDELKECHVYKSRDEVYVVYVDDDDNFSVIPCVVVQCLRNLSGFYFYVVRRAVTQPPRVEICVPMWFAFGNKYVAQLYLNHAFSLDDKTNILKYFKSIPSVRTARHQLREVVPDYVNLQLENKLPGLKFKKIYIEGAAAIGSPSFYLVPSIRQQVEVQNKRKEQIIQNVQVVCQTKDALTHSERLQAVIKENRNAVLMTRLVQNCLENLTLLVMARLQNKKKFNAVYHQLVEEIRKFYYSKDVKSRVYLDFVHYQVAIDVFKPGSVRELTCSLCGPEFPRFTDMDEFKDHYFGNHAVCARVYGCSTCATFKTRFPSQFRAHLAVCAPEIMGKLSKEFNQPVADSFADFLALQSEKDPKICLIGTGMPSSLVPLENENPTLNNNVASDFKVVNPELELWDGQGDFNFTDTDERYFNQNVASFIPPNGLELKNQENMESNDSKDGTELNMQHNLDVQSKTAMTPCQNAGRQEMDDEQDMQTYEQFKIVAALNANTTSTPITKVKTSSRFVSKLSRRTKRRKFEEFQVQTTKK